MEVEGDVFTVLTGDAQLATLFGGTPRVFNVWSPPEPAYPYITYRTRTVAQAPWAIHNVSLAVDVFDSGATELRTLNILRRIVHLLDRRVTTLSDGAIARYFLAFEMSIPEEERYIWHRSIELDVRRTRNADIAGITGG